MIHYLHLHLFILKRDSEFINRASESRKSLIDKVSIDGSTKVTVVPDIWITFHFFTDCL